MKAMVGVDLICCVCRGHDEQLPVSLGDVHRISSDNILEYSRRTKDTLL